MPSSSQDSLIPEFHVRIDGADLPPDAAADLIAASVHDDVEHPSAFNIQVNNWNEATRKMKWSDDDLFKEGKQVEVQMGYRDNLETLIAGEITGMELLVRGEQLAVLTVRGYDRGHRLARGRKTMSYASMTDGDIVNQIAGNAGLTAEIDSTSETYEYVLQHNQTDAEFIQGRARRIGYEFFVKEKKLVFRKRQSDQPEAVTISHDAGLIEFCPRLSTMQQVTAVQVRSWDPATKDTWIGRASVDDESNKMGADNVGMKLVSDAFGQADFTSTVRPAASQADADQLARGRLREMGLAYISGEGTSVGRTDLRAGIVAKIDGLGKRFSGLYYLTSTTHIYSARHGYRTVFQARRNAA